MPIERETVDAACDLYSFRMSLHFGVNSKVVCGQQSGANQPLHVWGDTVCGQSCIPLLAHSSSSSKAVHNCTDCVDGFIALHAVQNAFDRGALVCVNLRFANTRMPNKEYMPQIP